MTDVAEGIKDVLVTAGVGVFGATTGWGIFISREPDSDQDSVITIYNTGGEEPNPKWLLDFPSVQVRVRGDKGDYQGAHTKSIDIRDALLGLPSQLLNGDQWVAVNEIGSLNQLGYDSNDRPLFTLNYGLIVEPAAGGNRIPFP